MLMTNLTLKVKKLAFKNAQTKKSGYISRAISNGVMAFDDLTAEMAHNTTFHHSEVEAIFGLAIDTIAQALQQGKIVDLGKIGRIQPSLSSKWTEKADDQKLNSAKMHVVFRPSKAIKEAINNATLVWASEKEAADADKNGTAEDTDTEGTGGTVKPVKPAEGSGRQRHRFRQWHQFRQWHWHQFRQHLRL